MSAHRKYPSPEIKYDCPLERGHVRYLCDACKDVVDGHINKQFQYLTAGRYILCQYCYREYCGIYSPDNQAMKIVFDAVLRRRRPRKLEPDAQRRYAEEVRRLTEVTYRRYREEFDPFSRRKEPGQALDHIVPIAGWCAPYGVPASVAAALSNLRIIGAQVNILRRFVPQEVIGLPYRWQVKLMRQSRMLADNRLTEMTSARCAELEAQHLRYQ